MIKIARQVHQAKAVFIRRCELQPGPDDNLIRVNNLLNGILKASLVARPDMELFKRNTSGVVLITMLSWNQVTLAYHHLSLFICTFASYSLSDNGIQNVIVAGLEFKARCVKNAPPLSV